MDSYLNIQSHYIKKSQNGVKDFILPRKKYEKRYREKCRDYIALQKEKGLPELKQALMKITDERDFLKEDRARLFVQLEDLKNDIKLGKVKEN